MIEHHTRTRPDSASLPRGWACARLGELGRYLNGRGFKKSEWGTAGRPIIRIQDLTGTSANPNYFDGEVEERHVARSGDFLISWAATLGAYIYRGAEGLVNQHIFKVETFINQTFHFYAVTHAIEDMYRRARGTGMVHIIKSDFDSTEIPLPPLAEQARIADRIDELFTDLAAGVAALERVKRNLSRYRAAVLHAAVTGRLTEAWRKEHGPAAEPGPKLLDRILAERRRQWELRTLAKYEKAGKAPPKNWRDRYPEPSPPKITAEGTESGLPTLPESWHWASLDQISDLTGGVAKNQKEAGGAGMREVPYLRVANVQRGYLNLAEMKTISATKEDIDILNLKPGDVLFTEGGDRDKLGRGWVWEGQIAECIHQNHVFRARPYLAEVRSALMSHAGNSYGRVWFRSNGTQSVNLASISLGVLRQFPVPIAPLDEQTIIVEAVNEKLSQIDALEAEVARGLGRAGRLRQAILKAAFEGRLVPQDPDDEPANVLLERIRSEAAEAKPKPKPKPEQRRKPSRKAVSR